MLKVSSSSTGFAMEHAPAKFQQMTGRILAGVGTFTLLGNLAVGAGWIGHGSMRSVLSSLAASVVMVVFGAIFLRGERSFTATFNKSERTIVWSSKPAVGAPKEGKLSFSDVKSVQCNATMNYASVDLQTNNEPVTLVLGEPRSDDARARLAKLFEQLRSAGFEVRLNDLAQGSFWQLQA